MSSSYFHRLFHISGHFCLEVVIQAVVDPAGIRDELEFIDMVFWHLRLVLLPSFIFLCNLNLFVWESDIRHRTGSNSRKLVVPVKIWGCYWKLEFCFRIRFLRGKSVFPLKHMCGSTVSICRGYTVLTGFTATSVAFIYSHFWTRRQKAP